MNLKQIASNCTEVATLKGRTYFNYETPIAHYVFEEAILYVTTKKYSKTTSKHMNIVKKMYEGCIIHEVDQSFLDLM